MHIAICDDNPADLQQLQQLLLSCRHRVTLRAFPSALQLYECGERFDAVILDIEMEAPNGFEIALRMARQESHPIIIFATNSAAYAVQGYGLALRYLLKPLTEPAITEALDAVQQQLSSNRIALVLDGETRVLNVHDIRYAEVSGHRITVHTTGETIVFRGALRELLGKLPDRFFFPIHQSYTVNLLHVQSLSRDGVRLTDGTALPLSRRRQMEFADAFHKFLGV